MTICKNNCEREKYERRIKELENLLTVDELTGCINKKKGHEILDVETAKSLRNGYTFSILLIDIDKFKKINDNYGHLIGDYIIKEVARLIKGQLRISDYLIRWGGDEFFVILPYTELKDAAMIAGRIKNTIQQFKFNKIKNLSISIGVAEHDRESSQELFIQADKMLYHAKNSGRNSIKSKLNLEVKFLGNIIKKGIKK